MFLACRYPRGSHTCRQLRYICEPELRTDEIVFSNLLRIASLIVRHWSIETIYGATGSRVSKRKAPPKRISLETAWGRPFSCRLVQSWFRRRRRRSHSRDADYPGGQRLGTIFRQTRVRVFVPVSSWSRSIRQPSTIHAGPVASRRGSQGKRMLASICSLF